ncbi:putative secreted protein (Por secretion system target) [Winogradskyella pacifica]|uniref:Putative secreted protein (Por secretion system target) n=1 Tax=Winogradskyella pacifica TaxID=664642 RepID=A0A3D9N3J7_9FLAO|nr:YncE family protein [Winogradskyella pacifica]REE24523.1 putative secreted protein (Por secretion system target) [Winogradskyella pacifica]
MKNYYKKTLYILSAVLLSATSYAQDYSDGLFILNEGLFGTNTASVSHIDANGTLENDIFTTQNPSMTLGDTGQGMGFYGDFAYVILHYSDEIKVMNSTTFAFSASITDQLSAPRNIAFYDGYGYVTNWGDPSDTTDDYVAVIDLATNTITETILVAEGPEKIVQKNGKLFVAHQGGYGYGNSVSVIDIATSTVESITVGDVPSSLKVDDDYLYVLASGKQAWTGDETLGSIHKIDLSDYQNHVTIDFQTSEHPSFLALDATDLYYVLNNNIYKMASTDTTLPTVAFNTTTDAQLTYGFNKVDDKLYLLDAIDYVSPGKVFVYDESGLLLTQHIVGPLPNGVYKNEGTLSVNNYAFENTTIFPNPASGSFQLNLTENATVKLYDVSGKLVKNVNYTNTQPISLEGIETGMYLVNVEVKGNSTTLKLMVK